MNKFPLLEQLRAERQRQEDEITAPLREVIDRLHSRVESLAKSLRTLEKIVGSEIGKYAVQEIGNQIGAELRRHILEAMPAAHRSGASAFTLTLPTDILRFMDPKSVESEILRRYTAETAPRLSLRADVRPTDRVTVIDIRIPELGYRRAMSELN